LRNSFTEEEISKIITYAESLIPKEEIHSLYAYGPRIAGYSQDDSDYDIILVTKNIDAVSDQPPQGTIKSSPIIVDEKALMDAASHPSYSEFVIGRFLNIYEPLVNEEFLRNVELEYKRRIMAEELIEIETAYDDFSSNLILPYEYFLFKKLHDTAIDYPETIEGVGRTYKGARKKENLDFTLRGFRDAAEILASHGIVEKNDDSVRIFRGRKKRMNALSLLYKMYPLTTRGSIHNSLRSFASSTGFEYKTKPLQKLTIQDKVESIIELERPKKLLRLEEGVVFDDAGRMVEELARSSGFNGTFEFEEKKKGDYINSSKQLEIWDQKRRAKYILKHFPELKSVKWLVLNVWSLAAKRFNMSPLSRLNREVEAVRRLHGLGINTHRITGIVLDERTLVTEYTEGVSLVKLVLEVTAGENTETKDIRDYAQVLGKMHRSGLVYGDTKPHNALVSKDGIELLDLEQAVEGGDKAWDLAEFLYYSAKIAKQEEGLRLVAESFLEAYQAQNGNRVIEKAGNLRYMAPFLPFVAPKMRKVVRDALEKYASTNDIQ
jgi:tRNA A-37 threonylcarbamoyl transferase component Bud32